METTRLKVIKQPWRRQAVLFAPYIASGAFLILLPAFLSPYLQSIMTKFLIFAIFAMSLDILFGYTGLFSLGHAAYFGVAGYTAGILTLHYAVKSFWISALGGILMAGFVAAIFGIVALRVSGIYFLLVTFALGELLYSVAIRWTSMTGGSDGLSRIPRPDLGLSWFTWNATHFYYFVFLAFMICFYILYRLINSPFGHALQGIREQRARMQSLGYNVWLCKYIAFIVAGLFAGVAGTLYLQYSGYMAPANLGIATSALVLLMVIIGSTGTLVGPVIGAAVIILVEYFASLYTPEHWPLILGSAFVVVVMYLRGGIYVRLLGPWKKVSCRYGSTKS